MYPNVAFLDPERPYFDLFAVFCCQICQMSSAAGIPFLPSAVCLQGGWDERFHHGLLPRLAGRVDIFNLQGLLHGGATGAPKPGAQIFGAVGKAAMWHAINLPDLLPVQGGNDDENESRHKKGQSRQGIHHHSQHHRRPKRHQLGLAGTGGISPSDGGTATGTTWDPAIAHGFSTWGVGIQIATFEEAEGEVLTADHRLPMKLGIGIGE